MFVVNYKVNPKKVLFIVLVITIVVLVAIEGNKLLNTPHAVSYDYALNADNFTSVLKDTHTNISTSVDKTISLSGFVFTLPDFKPNTFVCGRNYILNGEEKVVGFMCEYMNDNTSKEFMENDWVEITGIIAKGYYLEEIPVIQIATIKRGSPPDSTYVTEP